MAEAALAKMGSHKPSTGEELIFVRSHALRVVALFALVDSHACPSLTPLRGGRRF